MKDNRMQKIAVVDSTNLYFMDKGQRYNTPLPLKPVNLRSLVETALYAGVDALWVLPGSIGHTHAGIAPKKFTEGQHYETRKSTDSKGIPLSVLAWRKNGTREERRAIMICFPGHDTRWGLEEITGPTRLLAALNALQDELELPIMWSPGHVGRALMKRENEGKREQWVRAPGQLPDMMGDVHFMAKDLRKKEAIPLIDGEWYLHVFDKNSMYLAAATGCNLGEGQPTLPKNIAFNAKWPGVWRYGDCWLWTPELEYHLKGENGLTGAIIEEAYVWPLYHQTLRSWGEALWLARKNLKEINTDAYEIIKAIATQGLGWLAHKPAAGNSQWYRPDWWSMIVATARAKMLYKAQAIYREYGVSPVWFDVDEIGFVSSDPNPRTAFPSMLTHEGHLGGFKITGSTLIDGEIIEAFDEKNTYQTCKKVLKRRLEKWT